MEVHELFPEDYYDFHLLGWLIYKYLKAKLRSLQFELLATPLCD